MPSSENLMYNKYAICKETIVIDANILVCLCFVNQEKNANKPNSIYV